MAKSTPLSTILSLLPSLSDRDREKLKAKLCQQTVCDVKGHQYKTTAVIPVWFKPPITQMVCSRCGKQIQT